MADGTGLRRVPREHLALSRPVWWLEARFHFSFADYYNPDNIHFGALRVLNDDLVKPGGDFGRHPHKDAEILTYVVAGALTHRKDGGQWESLGPGSVQHITAGTGVMQEEANRGDEVLRYIQLWLTPDRKGHRPVYGSARFPVADRRDCLLHVAQGKNAVRSPKWSCVRSGPPVVLQQDANVYVSECTPRMPLELHLAPLRQAYLLCVDGGLRVATAGDGADVELSGGDALEVTAPEDRAVPLPITAGEAGAHFMLIEMARGPTTGTGTVQ